MSYEKELSEGELRIGTKQTTKAVEQGKAAKLFVAKDADPKITVKIVNLARKMGVEVMYVDSMKQLGKACGIEVGAAMVAIVNE
ncbi:ribosomal L7Ae/L30e/S12e/Gadd45 family protein [Paenibacillus alkalitolerans]|uniref:ribosomal L7Ae/L30e/S12e/Gadd45 family protein n=1 Tax=Paenibacillus alkalitolerans TaxID=2799335 RepID=UPI0018F2954F|nr:ribosomal L7Ae/L30e/S12e/Gadd45 family protein [Paenibacillus alkalitolerans]